MVRSLRSIYVVGILIASTIYATATPAGAVVEKVAVWRMNETIGTTMYDSGALPANDGTIYNVTLGVPGIDGSDGYGFARGYVIVPSDPSLNPRHHRLRITIHADPTSLPTSGDFDLIRKGDSPGLLYKMEILQSGVLRCGFRGSHRSAIVRSTIPIVPNTGYYRLRCIKTRGHIKAAVGASVTSRNRRIGSIHNSQPVVLGAHGDGLYDFYKGSLDKAKIIVG